MVKKESGGWRMCVDFTNLNVAYKTDNYPLLSIDKHIDKSARYKLLSFMECIWI